MAEREVRYKIVGDASSAAEASRQAASGLDQLKQKTDESAKSSEKATFSHKDMHKAMHEIGALAPEVGIALRAMASAPAAGLAVLFTLLGKTKEGIENLNKSLTASDWDTSKLNKIQEALSGATIEAAKFTRELEAAAKAQETIAEKAEAVAKIHSAEGSATDKVHEAQKKFELAQTESIQDPEQKKAAQAQIELRYAADKKQREDADAKFKTNESYRQIANEGVFQEHNAAKIESARQHLAGLGSEKDVDRKIETEKARQEKTEKEIEEKQKRFEELQAKPWLRRSTPEQTEMNYLGQELEQLGSLRTQQQGLVHGLEQRRPGQVIAIQAAQSELSGLESEQTASVQRTRKLQEGLPTQGRIAGIEAGARDQVMATDMASELSSHHITVKQAIGFLKQGTGGNVGQLLAALTELARTMQGLQKQTPNSQEVQDLWRAVNEMNGQTTAGSRGLYGPHF
jgi:hypothetical protein